MSTMATQVQPQSLREFRCACGKLLFRGELTHDTVEVKCKRCGELMTFTGDAAGRKIVFRSIGELAPLLRDAPEQSEQGYVVFTSGGGKG